MQQIAATEGELARLAQHREALIQDGDQVRHIPVIEIALQEPEVLEEELFLFSNPFFAFACLRGTCGGLVRIVWE